MSARRRVPDRRIRCRDLPGPSGPYAAMPDGLRALDDEEVLAALAHNAMMLALHPEHVRRLIEQHERADRREER